MRRFMLSVGVIAVVTVSGVAAAVASDGRGTRSFVLTTVQTDGAEVPSGVGFVGTRFVGADTLMTAGGTVGRGVRSCEVVAPGPDSSAMFQCLITLNLPDGTLTLQAMPTLTAQGFEDVRAAVTGGTGDYRHARGEALMQELSPTEIRYSLDLR